MEGQVHIRFIFGGSGPYMEGQVHIRSICGGSDPYVVSSIYGGSTYIVICTDFSHPIWTSIWLCKSPQWCVFQASGEERIRVSS